VEQDKAEGMEWLQKAADKEDPIAQEFMAHIYENGDGAARDLVAAYTWWLLAWAYGQHFTFRHHLSVAEVEEAKKRARTFRTEHGTMNY